MRDAGANRKGGVATLTGESHIARLCRPGVVPKSVKLLGLPPLVWRLLHLRPMGLLTIACLALVLAGCIVPLPYEEVADGGAGADYPPVIVGATPAMPGPLTITRGVVETYTIDVKDKDVDDTLYVRVFRDYDPVLRPFPLITIPVPPGGAAVRHVNVANGTFCVGAVEDGVALFFDVVVADRPFLDPPANPPYQAVPEGAEKSRMTWVAVCQSM